MQNSRLYRTVLITIGVFLILLAGCTGTTQNAKFYKLSSLASPESIAKTQAPGEGVGIGIGPIKFPDHLDRPEIVTRTSKNVLELGEFNRWAGSLKEDFSRVLAENLSILLSTDYIFMHPFRKSTPIDYRVAVEVVRFDGELGKTAKLTARWNVFKGESKELKFVRRSHITAPVNDMAYESMVAGLSQTVERLSEEIAEAIKSLSP